jgi:sortase A
MVLLGVTVLGLVAYLFGLSRVQEARAQTRLDATLAGQLGNEVAPLGPAAPGAPVALLSVPAIGLRHVVVVEGTSAANLTLGPGHLRSTPLPGQAGMSVLYGRRATFGAPFAAIGRLRPGDLIAAVTQQGTATYKVAAVGDSQHPVIDNAQDRLVLLTASSAQIPSYYLEVDADLVSQPHAGPASLPQIGPSEAALASDGGAPVRVLLWLLALAVVSVASSYAAARWSPWPAYLAAVPVVLAVLLNLYQSLAALLPNLY